MQTRDVQEELTGCGPEAMDIAALTRSVEAEIVPRLMLVRGRIARRQLPLSPVARGDCDEADVAELARLLVVHDLNFAFAFVEAVRQRGISAQNICAGLLAPAARLLGACWEEDRLSIVQVTLGLCRLHQLLHRLCAEVAPAGESHDAAAHRALVACTPGEQHTFGAVMVGQFLRRAGWDVWNEFPATADALYGMVERTSFRVVGLSVGTDRCLDDLAGLVRGVRGHSRNRDVSVLLGGPLVLAQPQLAARVGADWASADGRDALRWMQGRHPEGARAARRG